MKELYKIRWIYCTVFIHHVCLLLMLLFSVSWPKWSGESQFQYRFHRPSVFILNILLLWIYRYNTTPMAFWLVNFYSHTHLWPDRTRKSIGIRVRDLRRFNFFFYINQYNILICLIFNCNEIIGYSNMYNVKSQKLDPT